MPIFWDSCQECRKTLCEKTECCEINLRIIKWQNIAKKISKHMEITLQQ